MCEFRDKQKQPIEKRDWVQREHKFRVEDHIHELQYNPLPTHYIFLSLRLIDRQEKDKALALEDIQILSH